MTYNLTTIAKEAMIERGFIPDFPPEVQQEIASLKRPTISSDPQIKDLRKFLWFSLDNDDSKDLDQLTFAQNGLNGKCSVYIAVADVSLLVQKNKPIDIQAAHNTTSVYTPSKVFPMLPERLSTDMSSLNPYKDRLAVIFEASLSGECLIENYEIYLGYVHNHAKLAYDNVSNWLDQKAPPPEPIATVKGLSEQIQLQDSIAQKLSKYRQTHGALTLETIEPHTILSNGVAVAISEMPKNRGRLLIENFMIIANTISARFAEANNLVSLRRVVTIPKRWDKIVEIAKDKGFRLPEAADSVALENFLTQQKQSTPLTFPDLSLTIIKLLGRGEYCVAEPGKPTPGHFGLALRDYTHSTAPNRRYPDLITQRLLIAKLRTLPSPYTLEELLNLAKHCTEKEDDAEKVERQTRKSAAAQVLSNQIGKQFSAIVTGAGPKGTWVRILTPPIEGKLVKGYDNLDVGDFLTVKLISTDVKKGFIDFIRIS